MKLDAFDWRLLKKYTNAQAFGDFSAFMDKMPQLAGQTALIAAGIAWASGAAFGLFATIQAKQLTALRAHLRETEALKPWVPTIKNVPVAQADIESFVATLSTIYKGLSIKQQGASVLVTAPTTADFGQFREAVGHIPDGGQGWHVSIESLCVGRECDRDKLMAQLSINKVSVEKPSEQN